ncbi:MAG TPA: class I SAM-dependent methyltransferase [Symbiobacteriaceae bacterium]|nr:class I SAM-dependent methyltransferase [Symbiobacteriaceae bacterium]
MARILGQYYHAIAAGMAIYRQSNERLVAGADLRSGMTVVDLGCGSGLTSLAALAAVPEGLKLILIDSRRSMIESAIQHVGARAAAYHVADASEVSALVTEKVDRVLCNLSFWYFKEPEAVLRELRKVIKPAGRLCFSLLGTYFNVGGTVVSPHWALLRVLADRGALPRALPDVDRLPNQRSIEGTLQGAGFKPLSFHMDEVDAPDEELANWLRLYPIADGATRAEAVERSLALLEGARAEMAAFRPRWRVVRFEAQPQINPEEVLLAKFSNLPR